jgi:hypothetical protein
MFSRIYSCIDNKMNKVYLTPSFYAHVLQSLLLLLALIYFVINYAYFKQLSQYQILVLLLLASAVIGIHSLSHADLESIYGFNPLVSIK